MKTITPAQLYGRTKIVGDCWVWTGSKNKKGYGQVRLTSRHERPIKNVSVHRLSFMLVKGQIPEGEQVCHTCDNPSCINPSHLFTGTNQANTLDSVSKGRHAMARKTECIKGHPFTPENTRMSNNKRYCIQCNKDRKKSRLNP